MLPRYENWCHWTRKEDQRNKVYRVWKVIEFHNNVNFTRLIYALTQCNGDHFESFSI